MRHASDTAQLAADTPIEALGLPLRVRKLVLRSDIRRLGELVLLTEVGVAGLRGARRADWPVIQEVQRRSGLPPADVPIIYLPMPASLANLLLHLGMRRLGDLLALSAAQVHALPGMSAQEAGMLVQALGRFGRGLRDDEA